MQTSTTLLTILQHTPPWVWPLLAALLAVGILQAFPRRVTLRRATLLPAAMLALSLWGIATSFGSAAALLAWAFGATFSAGLSLRGGGASGVRWSAADRSFQLPGSWVPLALILCIFSLKFVVGASLARDPGLRQSAALALTASLAYGVLSGQFAGRALSLWRLALGASAAQSAMPAPAAGWAGPLGQNPRP